MSRLLPFLAAILFVLAPAHAQYRSTADSIAAAQAAETALRLYRKGLPFDHEYNDADSTSMYCTELVRYAFRSAGVSLEGTPARRIPLPGFKYPCFLPSSVARAEGLQLLRAF